MGHGTGSGTGSGRGRRNCGDFCQKFARWIVVIINIIFFLLGVVVVSLGAVLVSKVENLQQNVELQREILQDLNVVVIALILGICGGIIILCSLCGIAGAVKQWRKCLVFYAATLFIILCIQLAMGVYLNGIDPSAISQRWHNAAPATRDAIQQYLVCCGWADASDTAPFPDCVYPNFEAPVQNCQAAAEGYIKTNIRPVAYAAMGIAAAEFVSIFATCGLIYTSKELAPTDDFFGRE